MFKNILKLSILLIALSACSTGNISNIPLADRERLIVETNAHYDAIALNPERLKKYNESDLKFLGVDTEKQFLLFVVIPGAMYHFKVKIEHVDGKKILVPDLSEDVARVKEMVLASPIFADFARKM